MLLGKNTPCEELLLASERLAFTSLKLTPHVEQLTALFV
jgi:hypothetical protein